MRTSPGAKPKYTFTPHLRHCISSTIPPGFPYWHSATLLGTDDKFYIRKSIWDGDFITVFDFSSRSMQNLPKEVVKEAWEIGEKLSDAMNHRIEDLFECLILARKKDKNN